MKNSPLEKSSHMWPIVDGSLKTGLEMTQLAGLSSWPEEKRRNYQKRRHNTMKSNDIYDDNPGRTSSVENTLLERESFAQPPVNACLKADSKIKQYDAEVSLSEYMNEGKEQKKSHNAPESNNISHDLQDGDGRPSLDLTDIKYFEKVDVNPVLAVAEQVSTSQRCEDTSSTGKHDGHTEVDVISLGAKTKKRKKQGKANRRKRRKGSNILENSSKSIEEGAGSSVHVVQNKMGDPSLDRSDEALTSGDLEKMAEREVIAGHGTSLQVVEDISKEKASGGCSYGEPAYEESKKIVEMGNLNHTIKEDGFVKKRGKRRKRSNILENSSKSIEEGAGSSVHVVQNKMGDPSLDRSDEALTSGDLEKMAEREVIAGHGTSLQVVEDISKEKASGGCSYGEPAYEESKKIVEMGNLNHTIKEDGFVKNVSVIDSLEENSEQANRGKINVIENAVQDVYSVEENFYGSSSFKEEKNLVDPSGSDLSDEHLDKNKLEIQPKKEGAISSSSGAIKDDASLVINNEECSLQVVQSSPGRVLTGCFRRKLLILDVNGLLVDIVPYVSDGYQADTVVARKAVFKRPFCDDFLQFCFERFNVGVWTSRTKRNVESVLDFLMGKTKHNLLFCWDQSHCTETGYNTVENRDKPLTLKELKKLWEKCEPNLPWERGEYNESNTLLLDDSPYKALCNPPYTAVFPYTYRYKDVKDISLGPRGDLRIYLEGLALCENVQKYVEQNPFGQRPITEKNLSWAFYLKVIHTVLSQTEDDANYSSAREFSSQPEDDANCSSACR
uniref:FCP1 homology domain-containing protein n=1 Tax=Davidia involucrata TaxID=16924 RepID=A0A5B6ZLW6_DAVIN